MIKQYKCKFYLNASHFIETNGKKGEIHSHCFEFVINTAPEEDEEIKFFLLEDAINKVLEPYQGKVINDIEPFDKINPTLEEMCVYFEGIFRQEAKKNRSVLLSLELSETPSRTYSVSQFS